MQDIADACGVTKPTIYYYFRDKYDLLQLLYQSVTKEFYEQNEILLRSSAEPDDKLRRLIEMQVFYSVEHRQFQRLFQRERHELKEPARSSIAQCERKYESVIEEVILDGQRKGVFRPIKPRLAMMIILGALSSVHRWAGYSGESPAAIADGVAAMVLDGLSMPPRPEREP
jgi:AcrR family transcriptional regulator